jgi:hypothetical protein
MTVMLELVPSVEARLRDRAAAAGVDPATFAARVLSDQLLPRSDADRTVQPVDGEAFREGDLLRRLDLGFSEAMWVRYRSLVNKRRDEQISPTEMDELLAMTTHLEEANVRRIEAVGEIAKLRGKPFMETFHDLGLGPVVRG